MDAINLKPEGEAQPIPKQNTAEPKKLCGQCRHAHMVSHDLREPLQCRYHPPNISSFISPQGLANISSYPQVRRDNAACFVGYSLKPALQQ